LASRRPRSSFSPYDTGAGPWRRRVADADAAAAAAAAVDGSLDARATRSASVPLRVSAEEAEEAFPASGRMLSTVALRDTDRAKSRRRNAKPRAARELDPGFDAPEPARRRRGDPVSDRAGDADASSDSSDDDSCALIGVVNPVEPLGVFAAHQRKFRKRDRNGFCFLAF
jgi:hypothetical protein